MDVNTTFLQPPVGEEIYVRQPEGFEVVAGGGSVLVCRLPKSLYGLKQAPRNWYKVTNKWITGYGVSSSKADECVYVLHTEKDTLVVVLCVGDLVVAGNNSKVIDEFKEDTAKLRRTWGVFGGCLVWLGLGLQWGCRS